MTAHKHAQDMARYAQDALQTDRPWELWEIRRNDLDSWAPCNAHPAWAENFSYRRKADVVERYSAVVRMPAGTIYVYEGKISEQHAREACQYRNGETLVCIVKVAVDKRVLESATTPGEMVKLDFVG